MNATGKRRLLKLADFLEKLPLSKNFNMHHYAGSVDDGKPACGTSACAAGWAASIPSFRANGYRLIKSRHFGIQPAVGRTVGWDALEAFFGLDRLGACEIFDTYNPFTRKHNNTFSAKAAARRIRHLVGREQVAADAANKRRGSAKRA